MRESQFISTNKDKWKSIDEKVKSGNMSAKDLEEAYIELSEDLSLARTRYPNRSVRVYLNNQLSFLYRKIFLSNRFSFKSIGRFYSLTVLKSAALAKNFLLASLLILGLGFATGWIGSLADKDFGEMVLGEHYMSITNSNIENGDPLGIYKYEDANSMFFGIFKNNFKVALLFIAFGALAIVGTVYLLFINGLVLGVFTWIFYSKGLQNEFILTVFMHGALEIMGMVIEGAAGMMIGYGLIFPGKYKRSTAFQIYSVHAIRLFIACIPIILVAAFIESYITRYTELNDMIRGMFIGLSVLFMLSYFVIIPLFVFRKIPKEKLSLEYNRPYIERKDKDNLPVADIKGIFTKSLNETAKNLGKMLLIGLLISTLFIQLLKNVNLDDFKNSMGVNNVYSIGLDLLEDINNEGNPLLTTVKAIVTILLTCIYSWKFIFYTDNNINALILFNLLFISTLLLKHRFLPKILLPKFSIKIIAYILFNVGLYLSGPLSWLYALLSLPFLCHVLALNDDLSLYQLIIIWSKNIFYVTRVLIQSLIIILIIQISITIFIGILLQFTENLHGGISTINNTFSEWMIRGQLIIFPTFIYFFISIQEGFLNSRIESNSGKLTLLRISQIKPKRKLYGVEI